MNEPFTHPRALSISGPALADLRKPLTPLRLVGTDGINQLFDYRLTLQTSDDLGIGAAIGANLDLDSVIGKEITCIIELEGMGAFIPGLPGGGSAHIGAGQREISALITAARFIGVDSRHALYEFTLRPWLHLATLTTDCKVFQNQTPVETIVAVLNDYAFVVDKRLIDTYPVRDYCVQYNESDFAFVTRLMQEWGINYHFEHSHGVHRLILSDINGAFRTASEAYATIPYYPLGHKIDREYIHAFSPENSLTSGSVASRDYDYTRCRSSLDANASDPRNTGQNKQELYSWHDAHSGNRYSQPNAGANPQANKTDEQGRFLTRLRIEERRQHGQRAKASAYLRGLAPGVSFTLTDHPQGIANREYVVIRTHFLIENVSEDTQRHPSQQIDLAVLPNLTTARSVGQLEHGLWRVQTDFTVQPSNAVVRPEHTQQKPRCYGPEVAIVTGPHGDTAASNIYTDQYGRIKVQFPWDRYGEVNQNSSCWVRVVLPWAGNQLGQQAIPRIGQEVIVDFIGGDPDRPICSGSVHNQFNMPPWQLPNQQALMGIRSRELTDQGGGNSATGRSNHLVLDDTHDQIQAQLKSDHDHSQLSLGFITRIENKQGRQEPRGQGFELRTDGRGAIRTKEGLLVSTYGRPRAANHLTDMGETVARLIQGQSLQNILAALAIKSKANDNELDQSEVALSLQLQNAQIAGFKNTATFAAASIGLSDISSEVQSEMNLLLRQGLDASQSDSKSSERGNTIDGAISSVANQLPPSSRQIGGVIYSPSGAVQHIVGAAATATQFADRLSHTVPRFQDLADGVSSTANGIALAMGAKGLQDIQSKVLMAMSEVPSKAAAGDFPELANADMVMSTPESYAVTAGGNAHINSGQHIALTSTQHTSIATGRRMIVSAIQGTRMFTQLGGMKYIAAAGKIDLQAQSDAMTLLALKEIQITSENGEIVIRSKKRICIESEQDVVVNGATSFTHWDASGVTTGTRGAWTTYAATHDFTTPNDRMIEPLVKPEKKDFSNRIDAHYVFHQHAFSDVEYQATYTDGTSLAGSLDMHGRTLPLYSSQQQKIAVLFGNSTVSEWDALYHSMDSAR
ncbi:type VI secretion system Vgr family protein [Undibacterium sp. MH2W]|uniref:type VI secretion system Vgr family protein n=1 Tax=Undibacterium sp. MH2W TaxID=3413044 RepID=UPI003BF235F3